MNPITLALFGALAAAFGTIFAKMGLKNVDANTLTAIRSLVMAGIVALAAISFQKLSIPHLTALSGKEWLFIILSGLGGALSWIFFFHALAGGPVVTITVIDKLSIVFVALLSVFVLAEKISVQGVIGLILISFGTVLVAVPADKLVSIFK